MEPLVVHGDSVEIEPIQAAIRARVRELELATHVPTTEEMTALAEARIGPLGDWNFPRQTWAAMWPPALEPWNLDQDFPIRSHRPGVGRWLVGLKRVQRGLLAILLRPFLAQQVEINRTLGLMNRTLADELGRERLRLAVVERRLGRMARVLGELRGQGRPLVVFDDEPRR